MLIDENKYVCLINNCMVEENKTFSEFKSSLDKVETPSQAKNEYDAVLMENLVSYKNYENIFFFLHKNPILY